MTADPAGSDGWLEFRTALEHAIGVPLGQYKEPQMKRRLESLMGRRGFGTWDSFAAALTCRPELLQEVRDLLTINVSEFWRQPERFEELRESWIPQLLAEKRRLRFWSAGCSIGCEPYSLAMILNELDTGGSHSVLATDVDLPALSRARGGSGYLPSEVRSVPPELAGKYLQQEADGTFEVAEEVKRWVTFRQHDLLQDPYPRSVDVILCRNVVIYFTEPAKQHIYRQFAEALRPGGLLFVGGSELIMRSTAMGFRSAGVSLYQRAA